MHETKEITKTIEDENSNSQRVEILGRLPQKGERLAGSGRKPGTLNKKTIEIKVAEEEFRQKILSELKELIRAQMTIAKGAHYLYKIVEEKDSKGKVLSKKHILVEDPYEIQSFLDELQGEDGIVNGTYYYMTTAPPDNRALDSLIDRVFGKSMQRTESVNKNYNITQIIGMRIIDESRKDS